ncbi:hypothetical protein TrCOL_g3295 [Triparma columacea]|nr:hypothetical protein TrCOL_g3295 [Triparma columacea]
MLWDMTTFLITLYSFYLTNLSISTRSYEIKESSALIELWFLLDVAISFVTEHVSSTGERTGDGRKVVLRYLRTWFVVDILSMIPWETFILKPIIDMQNNRGFFSKSFFRTKGIVKVTRVLRGRHFKLFGQLSRKTKHIGMGSSKLLKSLIKYLPKYIMFLRRMKIIIPLRLARGYHVIRKLAKDFLIWGGQVKRDVGGKVKLRRERLRDAVREVGGRWSPVRDPNTRRIQMRRRDSKAASSPSFSNVVKAAAVQADVDSTPPSPSEEEDYRGRRRTVATFTKPSPPSPHTVDVPRPTLKRRNTTSNVHQ